MPKEDKLQPEVPIKLEYSFIGSTFYVIFRLTQAIQAVLPTVLVWVAIHSALRIFRRPESEWKKESKSEDEPEPESIKAAQTARYRIDTKKLSHRIAWPILTKLHSFAQCIAGMHSDHELYQRLLVWNTQFPVLGYQDGGLDTAIEYHGRALSEGGRAWNLYWLTTPIPVGKFQIISKKLDEKGKATIQCVWITGKQAGTSFTVGPDFSNYRSWRDETLPARIYFPNRLLVWLAELVTSASLILAMIGLSVKGVAVIGTLWTKAGEVITAIVKAIGKLFQ